MSLSTPYETFEKPGLVASYKIAAVKIFRGAMVGVNAAGYAVPMTHATAGLRFIGVANETVDNAAGAAGDKAVNVTKAGSVVMQVAAPAVAADLVSEVFAVSDWEVQVGSLGLTNAYPVGTITAIESTSAGSSGVRLRIDAHVV